MTYPEYIQGLSQPLTILLYLVRLGLNPHNPLERSLRHMFLCKLVYGFEQTIEPAYERTDLARTKRREPDQVVDGFLETQGRFLTVLLHIVVHAYYRGHQFAGVIRKSFEALFVISRSLRAHGIR
jgi:hypothetical protein